jgi:GntR family transcriptional regulator of arabinose operon
VSVRRPSTARSRLAATLAEEIMQRSDADPFPIASEHELCRRFQISRVTVRLALGDLENRGLIYRRHGKGTYAHGRSKQAHRDLGFLMRAPQSAEHRPLAEMVRGAQNVMAGLRSAIVLLNRPPEEWRADLGANLGGVIVVPEEVTERDLQVLRDRNVPYILAAPSSLPGPRVDLGQRRAARAFTEQLLQLGHRRIALLSGYDVTLDDVKREGIHDALDAAGIDPTTVPEYSAQGEESAVISTVQNLLEQRPRPTAVIAFDDSLGSRLSCLARQKENLRVPGDLSIVSFHDWPYLHYIEPILTTVRFEFFNAGQRAAEALNHASLTGEPVTDISFEPNYRFGQTVGQPTPETV